MRKECKYKAFNHKVVTPGYVKSKGSEARFELVDQWLTKRFDRDFQFLVFRYQ